MDNSLGKIMIIVGVIILTIGILLYFFPNKLQWFGRLPGDIVIKKPNFTFYFPVTSMVLASLLLSLFGWLIRKILG